MTLFKAPTIQGVRAAAAGVAVMAASLLAPGPAAACVQAGDFQGIKLPKGCLSADEGRAVRLRIFRADLAVAALSCRQQDQYNSFVTRHRDELVRQGRALKALFIRLHQARAERELNRFITHLANRASLKRLAQPRYCRTMDRVFREAHIQPRHGLTAYVQGRPVAVAMMAAAQPGDDVRKLAAMETAAGDQQTADD